MIPRLVSALVALPPTLAAIYFGNPYFAIFAALAGALMAWEWVRLCRGRALVAEVAIVVLAVAGAIAAVGAGRSEIALAILAGGAIAGWAGGALRGRDSFTGSAGWLAAGVLYIGIPCVAMVWLRGAPETGRNLLFWLFAVVWAVDTGAYLAGSRIGGPKLAMRISPNKTWAGLLGGILAAAGVGALLAGALEMADTVAAAIAGGVLAVVAQAGDLLESWVKRHFGVKDAGSIMPGHGGLLDRVDGLLAAAVAVAWLALWVGRDLVLGVAS